VTHTDEAPDSSTYAVMTAGGPEAGETLVGRYQLEEHINDDSTGRRVWRGIDVVLRRPIAVILRYPGGDSASEMISAAIAASRITHPHLVDVYDAIDEEARAYVVREWVDGMSLRELLADGPLDSVRATSVAHAVASAVAAMHATGMPHGNVHPGSVLIADDGRVVLTDARTTESTTQEQDVRAIGAILYASLTGHWPHAEAGPDSLPDALRDDDGALASPRQARGGVPSFLSELATDLLNPSIDPPNSESLAQELGRLDTGDSDDLFGAAGALGFTAPTTAAPEPRARNGRKLAIGIAALLVVAAGGLVIASKIGGGSNDNSTAATAPKVTPSESTSSAPPSRPQPLQIASVRIVATKGDNSELDGADKVVDGKESTMWETNWYKSPTFGNLKPGLGVLLDLGSTMHVTSVQVDFDQPGATVGARIGNTDPGSGHSGDTKILDTYTLVGNPVSDAPSNTVLPIDRTTRYVLIWITKLPPLSAGKWQVGIDEISVQS
jgi:eukaryotic-like serine/threonine-protein kinase